MGANNRLPHPGLFTLQKSKKGIFRATEKHLVLKLLDSREIWYTKQNEPVIRVMPTESVLTEKGCPSGSYFIDLLGHPLRLLIVFVMR